MRRKPYFHLADLFEYNSEHQIFEEIKVLRASVFHECFIVTAGFIVIFL